LEIRTNETRNQLSISDDPAKERVPYDFSDEQARYYTHTHTHTPISELSVFIFYFVPSRLPMSIYKRFNYQV
jgi:hypothetical protein